MAKDNKTFDNEQIRQLAEILTDTGLSEIEVEQDGLKIRVAREISASHAAAPAPGGPGACAKRCSCAQRAGHGGLRRCTRRESLPGQ